MQWFSKQILVWATQERVTFTKEWALQSLPITVRAFEAASTRAIARGELLQPRRGFYVIVSPLHFAAGAPPVMDVIDGLMSFENADYYLGLRKAAELFDVLDRSPSDFQIISSKRMEGTQVGRARLIFHSQRRMPANDLVERRGVAGGRINVSRPALTAADLIRYREGAGNNLFDLLFELGGLIDPGQLELLSQSVPTPVLQRLGFAFDRVGQYELADHLFPLLDTGTRGVSWLEAVDRGRPDAIFDKRWKVHCYAGELPKKE